MRDDQHWRVTPVLFFVSVLLFYTGCQPTAPAPVQTKSELPQVDISPIIELPPTKTSSPVSSSEELSKQLLEQAQVSLQRGLDWLLAQQAADGGWHSQTYGPFKGGAATTSLVLYTASNLPLELRQQHQAAWERGWKFLEPGVRKKGFVVCPDGTMDEPVYATALVLIAARKLELNIDPDLIKSMQDFLWQERCGPERGFEPSDPNYGGWDLAGGTGLRGETPGSNISITRFAVEALRPEVPDSEFPPATLAWARRVQNLPGDGGFFFHPERAHDGNKAQWVDGDAREKPRSYGTATCDGILLLKSLNVSEDDLRLQSALTWLVNHLAVNRVPGFEDASPEIGWQQGLLFYYLKSLAEVCEYLPEPVRTQRRESILAQLVSTQQADGSWQNESARMREDDPLIATSFAVVALSQ